VLIKDLSVTQVDTTQCSVSNLAQIADNMSPHGGTKMIVEMHVSRTQQTFAPGSN